MNEGGVVPGRPLNSSTFVVGDACATFPQRLLSGRTVSAQDAHDLALAELHGEFATVVDSRQVLESIAGSPQVVAGMAPKRPE
ncbi:MAG: hypothetical protein ABR562_01080 [Thermoplasmatota archaeon]|nr:hypothetical protein [Halobacteriales archaeon]